MTPQFFIALSALLFAIDMIGVGVAGAYYYWINPVVAAVGAMAGATIACYAAQLFFTVDAAQLLRHGTYYTSALYAATALFMITYTAPQWFNAAVRPVLVRSRTMVVALVTGLTNLLVSPFFQSGKHRAA